MLQAFDITASSPFKALEGDESSDLSLTKEDIYQGSVIMDLVREKLEQRFASLREAFLKVDADRSGYISRGEFREACSNWGVEIDEFDFECLNATYEHKESEKAVDKGIGYLEFINLITNECMYTPGEGEGEIHWQDAI